MLALLSAMRRFVLKRIQPRTAAAVGPIVDARLARDAAVQRALTELENRWRRHEIRCGVGWLGS
jgi:hypothetical protein